MVFVLLQISVLILNMVFTYIFETHIYIIEHNVCALKVDVNVTRPVFIVLKQVFIVLNMMIIILKTTFKFLHLKFILVNSGVYISRSDLYTLKTGAVCEGHARRVREGHIGCMFVVHTFYFYRCENHYFYYK